MITQRTRTLAVAAVVLLGLTALGIRIHEQTETIPPQSPTSGSSKGR